MGGACTVVACGNGNTVPLTTPGEGKTWGDYVTINPDPSTSRKQPWKCTLCHHKYGKTSANASRVGQHVCGKEGNVKGCPGATHEDKKRFPRFISLPQEPTVPSSSTTTASATSHIRPSPSSLKRPRERTEEDVRRETFSEQERQALVTNRLENVVPNIARMLINVLRRQSQVGFVMDRSLRTRGDPPQCNRRRLRATRHLRDVQDRGASSSSSSSSLCFTTE